MKKAILITLICIIACGVGISQTLFLPQEVGEKRAEDLSSTQVEFYEYPYVGESIDLRDFKKRHPSLIAPDVIQIKAQRLANSFDLTVLIGMIKNVEPTEESIVIWLASDYYTNDVLFFVDEVMGRNFSENSKLLKLSSSDDAVLVKLNPHHRKFEEQKLWLKAPVRINRKDKRKILNQIAFGLYGGIESGGLDFSFDNLEKGFPTWYDVNFTGKSIGLELSYNLPNVRLAADISYQSMYSYTSYLNIQYDVPKVIVSNGARTVRDRIEVTQNSDRHSSARLNYQLTLGYRIGKKATEVQPFVSYGLTSYLPGKYVSNRFDDAFDYNLPSSAYYEGGMRFEFVVASHRSVFIDVSYQVNSWKPVEYFDTYEYENLRINHNFLRFKLGYRFGL